MREHSALRQALETIGIPVAYRQFRPFLDAPVPPPPYLVYYFDQEEGRGADGKNLLVQKRATVELYTEKKDHELEQRVEAVLSQIEWEKYEEYIESEDLFQTSYEFDIYEKIGGNHHGG